MIYTVVPANGVDVYADDKRQAARRMYRTLSKDYPEQALSNSFYVISDEDDDPDEPDLIVLDPEEIENAEEPAELIGAGSPILVADRLGFK